AHRLPPAPDGLGRELRRVVIDADTYPAIIHRQIVDASGRHLAELLVREVMNLDLLRRPARLPLSPWILEIPDQFSLLRVHRDDRLTLFLKGAHLLVDIPELGVT